jgi:hypothetical protein
MRAQHLALAALVIPACGGPQTQYGGARVNDYLPLEGDREWEYIQCDPGDDSCTPDAAFEVLLVEKAPNTTSRNNTEIVTLDYSVLEPTELLFSIQWSSNSRSGIQVWGWSDAAGEGLDFASPVTIADYGVQVDDVSETETDGVTYTSTYLGEEECPNHWVSDPYTCLHFRVEGGSDGNPIAGDWWFAQSWGMVKYEPASSAAPWVLRCAEFDNDNC